MGQGLTTMPGNSDTSTQDWIDTAHLLDREGFPRSALTLLEICPAHGRLINSARTRLRTRKQRMPPNGIYALVLVEGRGIAVPIRVRPGRAPERCDTEARDAMAAARLAVISLLGLDDKAVPDYWASFEHPLNFEGASLGLAFGLALLLEFTDTQPATPVFATGRLTEIGQVLGVTGLPEKTEAVQPIQEALPGLRLHTLLPRENSDEHPRGLRVDPVASLEEAARIALAAPDPRVEPRKLEFGVVLERARQCGAQGNHEEAIRLMEAWVGVQGLPYPDAALLHQELGVQKRHLGRSPEAFEELDEAIRLADLARKNDAFGAQEQEDLNIQGLATLMDSFLFEELQERLEHRMLQEFNHPHNRIRCRGMLAQVYTSVGRHKEALNLRQTNLREQQTRSALQAEIPWTLCALLQEAARLQDCASFEEYAEQLLGKDASHSEFQRSFNDLALIRGLAFLGRFDDALAWSIGEERFGGVRSDSLQDCLAGQSAIQTYPLVSTIRSLARALRRTKEPARAESLCGRVAPPEDRPLVAWMADIARIEGAMATAEQGREDEARALLKELAGHMRRVEPKASRGHQALLNSLASAGPLPGTIRSIEAELDRLFY